MLKILTIAAICAMAQPAFAQSQILYASPEDVAAAIARAKAAPTLKAEPVVAVPPLRVAVEYRANPTPASLHEQNNELVNILDGSGTMIVGGKLKDEKRRDSANLNGSGIEGGVSYALVKGAYLFIPAGTPHYFASIGKDGLVISTTYIPVQAKSPN
jgi:mannose-6-phosphate isomerase-like protein (cupin superfamily)